QTSSKQHPNLSIIPAQPNQRSPQLVLFANLDVLLNPFPKPGPELCARVQKLLEPKKLLPIFLLGELATLGAESDVLFPQLLNVYAPKLCAPSPEEFYPENYVVPEKDVDVLGQPVYAYFFVARLLFNGPYCQLSGGFGFVGSANEIVKDSNFLR
ncbi:MAG: hypothetical protein EZS28_017161, partial [Streblomastix strix]